MRFREFGRLELQVPLLAITSSTTRNSKLHSVNFEAQLSNCKQIGI